jgi:hypothetical protein
MIVNVCFYQIKQYVFSRNTTRRSEINLKVVATVHAVQNGVKPLLVASENRRARRGSTSHCRR